MIVPGLLAFAAAETIGAVPHLPYAAPSSAAYRACVVAERRKTNLPVADIGRVGCAEARSALFAQIRDHVAYRWSAIGRTRREERKIRAGIDRSAKGAVASFEQDLETWLANGGDDAGR